MTSVGRGDGKQRSGQPDPAEREAGDDRIRRKGGRGGPIWRQGRLGVADPPARDAGEGGGWHGDSRASGVGRGPGGSSGGFRARRRWLGGSRLRWVVGAAARRGRQGDAGLWQP